MDARGERIRDPGLWPRGRVRSGALLGALLLGWTLASEAQAFDWTCTCPGETVPITGSSVACAAGLTECITFCSDPNNPVDFTCCGDGDWESHRETCDWSDLVDSGCVVPAQVCFGDCSGCEQSCGNGEVEPFPPFFEECDDALPFSCPDGDSCEGCQCRAGYCGDGVIDAPAEDCDPPLGQGLPVGCTAGNSCDGSCQCRVGLCGDGNIDAPYEECDLAAFPNGCTDEINTACGPKYCDCYSPVCGDGTVDPITEVCDPGMFPTGCIAPEFCSSSCICEVPVCGDDVADGPEECDGIDNVMCHPIETCVAPGQPNECTCGPPPTCGNEVVDGAEECDNTAADSDCGPNMVCTASCFCFHADEIPALPRWQLGLLAAALLGSAGASYRWWARRQAPSR